MRRLYWLKKLAALMILLFSACIVAGQERSHQKQLFLPSEIYGVPGLECNIYFKNIFLTVNHENYLFDVTCPVGRNDLKRWRFVPSAGHAGKSYLMNIKVRNDTGIVAEASATLRIAPSDAGKDRKISILMIGDSLTAATYYPLRLHSLCKGKENPVLSMIGSHRGGGYKPYPGGVAHEGYGGWRWSTFMNRFEDESQRSTPYGKFAARSKFLVLKNDKVVFDFEAYLNKYNRGEKADIITFLLGVNDVFFAEEENLQKAISEILSQADALVGAFRKAAPHALIGIGYVTPGAGQDAFGNKYGCGQSSWGYFRNSFRLNQAMAEHFSEDDDPLLTMIPTQINLDTEHNFPMAEEAVNHGSWEKTVRQCNGVHPSRDGYQQIGDTFYAWLKYQLFLKSGDGEK